MVEDDEVVFRATVNGFCNSKKCSGRIRSATKTVFGNGDIVLRCSVCKDANNFVEGTDPAFDPNWKLDETPVEDEGKEDRATGDWYRRRKGRKNQ